ncbi:MAG: hypothetical protein V4623_08260 [Pseudomonadota bacterium]
MGNNTSAVGSRYYPPDLASIGVDPINQAHESMPSKPKTAPAVDDPSYVESLFNKACSSQYSAEDKDNALKVLTQASNQFETKAATRENIRDQAYQRCLAQQEDLDIPLAVMQLALFYAEFHLKPEKSLKQQNLIHSMIEQKLSRESVSFKAESASDFVR